jgi:hypothetical protein
LFRPGLNLPTCVAAKGRRDSGETPVVAFKV